MRPRIATLLVIAGAASACSSSSSPVSSGWTSDGGSTDAPATGPDAVAPDASTVDAVGGDANSVDGSSSDGGTSGPDSSPVADAGGSEAGVMRAVEMTFYGWDDNSPPGAAIAYPTIHTVAGGTGTYADPITYATDKSELAPGTRVYAPVIEKYLVMEDDCGQCDTDWGSMKWHIDVWMNSNGMETASALYACEDQWTQTSTTIEIDPPPGRLVTTNPLFDPSTNTCRSTP
jgi:hypothetical protein